MKIAHLITTLSHGGAENQLLKLCRGLKKEGFDVIAGCLKPGGTLREEFEKEGIPVKEFRMRNALDFMVYFRIRDWLQSQKPNLVHTHLFKADFWGGLAALSLEIACVSTKWNEDRYLDNRLIRFLVAWMGGKCVRMIAVSKAIKYLFVHKLKFQDSAIQVIYPGIEKSDQPHAFDEQKIRFGVVGRLAQQKGHRALFQAVTELQNRLPDFQVVLIGDGPDGAKLRRIVRKKGLQDKVYFLGLIREEERIYSEFDILVLPSYWEGSPVVILEAMERGIPIVASNVGGVPELVGLDLAILVRPGDWKSLARAMAEVGADPALQKRMSEKGKKRAKIFYFQSTLDAHINLYRNLLRWEESE